MKVSIIRENCQKSEANDMSLPYTAYLVTYKVNGELRYDITMSSKTTALFDHYYDMYKKDFIRFDQTDGRISPKLWGYEPPSSSKKKS